MGQLMNSIISKALGNVCAFSNRMVALSYIDNSGTIKTLPLDLLESRKWFYDKGEKPDWGVIVVKTLENFVDRLDDFYCFYNECVKIDIKEANNIIAQLPPNYMNIVLATKKLKYVK